MCAGTAAVGIIDAQCYAAAVSAAPDPAAHIVALAGLWLDWQRDVAALRDQLSRRPPPHKRARTGCEGPVAGAALTDEAEFGVLAKAVRDSRKAATDALDAHAPAIAAYWVPRMAELGWRGRVEARKAAAMVEARGADGVVLTNTLHTLLHDEEYGHQLLLDDEDGDAEAAAGNADGGGSDEASQ